jgi:2-dehydro-3-deoxygalactonokinase
VWLVSGLRSETDILRGEETEILGLFQLPGFAHLADDALVIKPGTHSKHVRIRAGQVVDFQTFMTGELFDLLSRQSVLRHSVQQPEDAPGAESRSQREAIRLASADALTMPLSAALFQVRTRQVLAGRDPVSNRAYLSGLLVASELAYLTRAPHREVPLILCAASAQQATYQEVAEELNLAARISALEPHEVDQLSARGQALLLNRLETGVLAG